MTSAQYARLYAVLAPCSYCGAYRGQFCTSKKGKLMDKSWHTDRAAGARFVRRTKQAYYRRMLEDVQKC